MRVEIFIDPGYTLRHYDCQSVADIEKAKQDFIDELKENIGTEHLQSSVETAEELAREIEWQRKETENQARKAGEEAKE